MKGKTNLKEGSFGNYNEVAVHAGGVIIDTADGGNVLVNSDTTINGDLRVNGDTIVIAREPSPLGGEQITTLEVKSDGLYIGNGTPGPVKVVTEGDLAGLASTSSVVAITNGCLLYTSPSPRDS